VALNLLQRLSGVATLTQRLCGGRGHRRRNFGYAQDHARSSRARKYAVRAGGGRNHRKDLGEAVLIKENHIRLAGGVSSALAAGQAAKGHAAWIEIEVTNLDELWAALAYGPDVILLDNMSPALVRQAVEQVRATIRRERFARSFRWNHAGERPGIRRSRRGLDSVGALTHSAPAVDLSFEIEPT